MSFESPGFTAHRAAASQHASLSVDVRSSYAGPSHPHLTSQHSSGSRRSETHLAAWFAKSLGFAILAASALFVAALLTWSIADPSFSNPGLGLKPTNALGPIGAILSDIVIQSLGLASVFALLPPVFWAAQLLSRHGIEGARAKLVMAPVAVLCLAAFLSGLPKASVWPLGSGYGGLLGDFGFQFVTGLFGIVNVERAPLVTGVCLMAAGFSLLMLSLGLTPADLKRIAERRRTHVPDSGWVSHLKGAVSASDEDVLAAGPMSHATTTPVRTYDAPAPSAPSPSPVTPYVGSAAQTLAPSLAASVNPSPVHQAPTAPVPMPQAPVHHVPVQHVPVQPVRVPPEAVAVPTPAPVSVASQRVAPAPEPVAAPEPAPQKVPRLGYRRPPISLLPQSTTPRTDGHAVNVAEKLRGRKLVEVLDSYGVRAEVKGHLVGPVVTTFTIETAAGTRSSRLLGLADDIARGLGVPSVRLHMTAARSAVSVEIPHDDAVSLGLRDFIAHASYHSAGHALPLVLGASARGEPCVTDLAGGAVLVAGRERASRDALIDTAITSLVYRHAPSTLRFVLVATDVESGRSFERWANLPHLAVPIAADLTQAADLLAWAAAEIDARTLRMRTLAQAQTIEDYNQRLRAHGPSDTAPMPYLVLVIADLAALVGDGSATRLSALDAILRRGKSAGVHLIAATASAADDALPPPLVAAFPVRVAAQVATKAESRALFGETGAEHLPARGDILVLAGSESLRTALGGGGLHRLHAALIRATEAAAIAAAAAKPGEILAEPPTQVGSTGRARDLQHTLQQHWTGPSTDSLYDRAIDVVRRARSAQSALLKSELSLTTAMALELLEQMAQDGIVSKPDADGQRHVLLGRAA